jgi:hypothetical protein
MYVIEPREITIRAIAYHHNGRDGEPFHVVCFTYHHMPMLGVVFDEPGHVVVFHQTRLGEGVIAPGVNGWKGDDFEDSLRHYIDMWEAAGTVAGDPAEDDEAPRKEEP